MRKTVIILILALLGVYAALSLVTKGDEYAAERLLFKAVDAYQKIAINPDVAPPGVVAAVENKFKAVIGKYPATGAGQRAQIFVAEFYMSRDELDKAMAALDAFIDAGYDDAQLASKAHLYKAATYEKQAKWDEALKEYKIIRDKYFNTPLGISVPIYIGRCYARMGDNAKADSAYREAVMFYEQMEKANRGKQDGFIAADLMVQTYLETGKLEAAGSAVEALLKNYPSQQGYQKYLPVVEYIYVVQLNRPEKAAEIYKSVVDKVENSNLKEFLGKKIDELEGKSAQKPEQTLSK